MFYVMLPRSSWLRRMTLPNVQIAAALQNRARRTFGICQTERWQWERERHRQYTNSPPRVTKRPLAIVCRGLSWNVDGPCCYVDGLLCYVDGPDTPGSPDTPENLPACQRSLARTAFFPTARTAEARTCFEKLAAPPLSHQPYCQNCLIFGKMDFSHMSEPERHGRGIEAKTRATGSV